MSEERRGVGLRITPEPVASADEVWARLARVPSPHGWVCLPNRVVRYEPGLSGLLLAAEVVGEDRVSVHVRRTDDGWGTWTYEELPDGDLVAYDEERVATGEGLSHLRYTVYWGAVEEDAGDEQIGVYRPYVARFTGWRSE